MSSGGKGGSSGTQVQKSEPWGPQQPYLKYGFGEARANYADGGPQFFPNATYVPFSQQSEQAMGMLENRAKSGSPVERGMQRYVTSTMRNPGGGATLNYLNNFMRNPMQMGQVPNQALTNSASGQMLNSNPYLDSMYNNASRAVTERFNDAVLPGINASFAGAGGSGSGIQRELAMDAADELGQNLSGLAANIYGNNYAVERQNQLNAANALNSFDLASRGMGLDAAGLSNQLTGIRGQIAADAARMAPTAAGLDYQNIAQLGNVGSMVESKAGEVLGDQMDRYNFYQNLPEQNLANYISAIQGNYGGRTISGTLQNPWAGAMGGAMSGASTGAAVGGPWGAVIGGVIGAGTGYYDSRKNNKLLG